MPRYVDGFVIPVPRKNIAAYLKIARVAAKVWKDHGALEYREAIGQDLAVKMTNTFPKQLKTSRAETVVFSWIVFKSRAHRDRVNKKVMADPRLEPFMNDPKTMPFDVTRMLYGGFSIEVDA